MIPSELTDFKRWRRVQTFVKKQLSMQYEDLRKLMTQPGYNLLVAAGLCNLVSGLAVSVYKPAKTKKEITDACGNKKMVDLGDGDLFKMLLESFYPWQRGERRKRKALVIYKFVRNPLAHRLGVGKKNDPRVLTAKCKKDKNKHTVAWSEEELDAIERSDDLNTVPVALKRKGDKWILVVEHFYLGLFKMLRRLAKDETQMREAQNRFASGRIVWHK